jgi:hypothetical protein
MRPPPPSLTNSHRRLTRRKGRCHCRRRGGHHHGHRRLTRMRVPCHCRRRHGHHHGHRRLTRMRGHCRCHHRRGHHHGHRRCCHRRSSFTCSATPPPPPLQSHWLHTCACCRLEAIVIVSLPLFSVFDRRVMATWISTLRFIWSHRHDGSVINRCTIVQWRRQRPFQRGAPSVQISQ